MFGHALHSRSFSAGDGFSPAKWLLGGAKTKPNIKQNIHSGNYTEDGG